MKKPLAILLLILSSLAAVLTSCTPAAPTTSSPNGTTKPIITVYRSPT